MEPQIIQRQSARLLCVAEIRGNLSLLNDLATKHNASAIIHTGNFGFFDENSISRIPSKTLQTIAVFSPFVDAKRLTRDPKALKATLRPLQLSQLPLFLSKELELNVPVYTVYGASEDLVVLEKFKSGEYHVPNLHIINEQQTFKIVSPDSPVVRLFGLGGQILLHRLFDNGAGSATIAGSSGAMWTTLLQMGQLINTVRQSYDPNEIRIFVTHPPPSREGLLMQLALMLRADFTVSSGLHFINGLSFNEFSVSPSIDALKSKLDNARAQFYEVWGVVRDQVLSVVESNASQKSLLNTALQVVEEIPADYLKIAFKNLWHLNLCDATFGHLLVNVNQGRVGLESVSEGFYFGFRERLARKKAAKPAPKDSKEFFAERDWASLKDREPRTAREPSRPKPRRITSDKPQDSETKYNENVEGAKADKPKQQGDVRLEENANSKDLEEQLKNVKISSGPNPEERSGAATAQNESESTDTKAQDSRPLDVPSGTEALDPESKPGADSQEPELDAVAVKDKRPGVWIASAESEEAVTQAFDERDRPLIKEVVLKPTMVRPNKQFGLVYFDTIQHAQDALARLDQSRVVKASLIGAQKPGRLRISRGRGSFRGGSIRGRGRWPHDS